MFKMEAYFTAARRGWPLDASLLSSFPFRALISNAESGNQAPLKLVRSRIESCNNAQSCFEKGTAVMSL